MKGYSFKVPDTFRPKPGLEFLGFSIKGRTRENLGQLKEIYHKKCLEAPNAFNQWQLTIFVLLKVFRNFREFFLHGRGEKPSQTS